MDKVIKIIRSTRKTLSVIIKNGEVIVRAPLFYPENKIKEFLDSKSAWILKHLSKSKKMLESEKFTQEQIAQFKRLAKPIIKEKAEYFSKIIGVKYNGISIRAQKTLWGSCTIKGKLNFNCLLINAPSAVLDYVIIHELCHLIEMNHSKRFWSLVYRYCKNYKECKVWLKNTGATLLNKI